MAASLGADNPFRYRGYYYDNETGLYYLNARYYNPQWGRFINADSYGGSTGKLLSHNVFAYCANNPVMASDPSGNFWYYGNIQCSNSTSFKEGQYIDRLRRIDEVARKWVHRFNLESISKKTELLASIYERKDGSIGVTKNVETGAHGGSADLAPEVPEGTKRVAYIHAHGDYGWEEDDNFSPNDKTTANFGPVLMYVCTPAGYLRRYEPYPRSRDIIIDYSLHFDHRDPDSPNYWE